MAGISTEFDMLGVGVFATPYVQPIFTSPTTWSNSPSFPLSISAFLGDGTEVESWGTNALIHRAWFCMSARANNTNASNTNVSTLNIYLRPSNVTVHPRMLRLNFERPVLLRQLSFWRTYLGGDVTRFRLQFPSAGDPTGANDVLPYVEAEEPVSLCTLTVPNGGRVITSVVLYYLYSNVGWSSNRCGINKLSVDALF